MRIAHTGHAEAHSDAPPEAVWALVADVTRVGEWSGECRRARWLGEARRAAVGARFRGYNRSGLIRWSRSNELVTVDEPEEIAWRTLPSLRYPDSTQWRIRLTPDGTGGTTITQDYEVIKIPAVLDRLFAIVIPAHRDRDAGLGADLARLAARAEELSG